MDRWLWCANVQEDVDNCFDLSGVLSELLSLGFVVRRLWPIIIMAEVCRRDPIKVETTINFHTKSLTCRSLIDSEYKMRT